MRKRERENPCGVCGHYHKYEEGEVCGICGHRVPATSEKTSLQVSAFPSEILPEFLYLGSYDNASRSELLKTQGISRVLNLHGLVILFLVSSPAIVIAFLMKCKGWRLAQGYQWVKERRPSVELTESIYQQLQAYEQKVFGLPENSLPTLQIFPPVGPPSFGFGFPKTGDPVPITPFNTIGATSIFSRPTIDVPSHEFTFGAGQTQNSFSSNPFGANPRNSTSSNIQMDSA
uniref:Uncharacterized protein n=1 Tax=Cucumis melo TaxID=3656 RepID=A0A9I9D846_CUCME